MLVARDSSGARRVAGGATSEDTFFCPGCESELVVRLSEHRVAHFAHRAGQACTSAAAAAERRRAANARRRARAVDASQIPGQLTLADAVEMVLGLTTEHTVLAPAHAFLRERSLPAAASTSLTLSPPPGLPHPETPGPP